MILGENLPFVLYNLKNFDVAIFDLHLNVSDVSISTGVFFSKMFLYCMKSAWNYLLIYLSVMLIISSEIVPVFNGIEQAYF